MPTLIDFSLLSSSVTRKESAQYFKQPALVSWALSFQVPEDGSKFPAETKVRTTDFYLKTMAKSKFLHLPTRFRASSSFETGLKAGYGSFSFLFNRLLSILFADPCSGSVRPRCPRLSRRRWPQTVSTTTPRLTTDWRTYSTRYTKTSYLIQLYVFVHPSRRGTWFGQWRNVKGGDFAVKHTRKRTREVESTTGKGT